MPCYLVGTEAVTMFIERFKGIAGYLSERTGLSITENATRKYARRAEDPLPIKMFSGRVVASDDELDAWVERQWGKPKGNGRNQPLKLVAMDPDKG
jgi:hypothetical protein